LRFFCDYQFSANHCFPDLRSGDQYFNNYTGPLVQVCQLLGKLGDFLQKIGLSGEGNIFRGLMKIEYSPFLLLIFFWRI